MCQLPVTSKVTQSLGGISGDFFFLPKSALEGAPNENGGLVETFATNTSLGVHSPCSMIRYCGGQVLGTVRGMVVTHVALEDTTDTLLIIYVRVFQISPTYSVPKETDMPMPWMVGRLP